MAAFDEDAFVRRLGVSQVRWGRVRWFKLYTNLSYLLMIKKLYHKLIGYERVSSKA